MVTERISLQDAADVLGVHYMTAYRYVRTGRLAAVKDGAEWRVDPTDLAGLEVGRRSRAGATDGPTASEAPTTATGTRAWTAEPIRLAGRLLQGDEPGTWQLIEDALTAGATPESVYTDLLVPAMAEVGDRWASGDATVADEHTATVTVQRLVGRLGPSFARRGRKRGTIVLGAAPGDSHGLTVSLLADPLRGRGFGVVDLGANVPIEAWLDAVQGAERLKAVGISVIAPGLDSVVAATTAALHAATDVPVVLGGGGIVDEAHARALGADGWAPTHGHAVELFDHLTRT